MKNYRLNLKTIDDGRRTSASMTCRYVFVSLALCVSFLAHADGDLERAVHLREQGNINEAIRILRKLSESSGDVKARVELAASYFSAGKYEVGSKLFKQILRDENIPKNVKHNISRFVHKHQRHIEAHAQSKRNLFRIKSSRKNLTYKIAQLKKIEDRTPEFITAKMYLLLLYIQNFDAGKAQQKLDEMDVKGIAPQDENRLAELRKRYNARFKPHREISGSISLVYGVDSKVSSVPESIFYGEEFPEEWLYSEGDFSNEASFGDDWSEDDIEQRDLFIEDLETLFDEGEWEQLVEELESDEAYEYLDDAEREELFAYFENEGLEDEEIREDFDEEAGEEDPGEEEPGEDVFDDELINQRYNREYVRINGGIRSRMFFPHIEDGRLKRTWEVNVNGNYFEHQYRGGDFDGINYQVIDFGVGLGVRFPSNRRWSFPLSLKSLHFDGESYASFYDGSIVYSHSLSSFAYTLSQRVSFRNYEDADRGDAVLLESQLDVSKALGNDIVFHSYISRSTLDADKGDPDDSYTLSYSRLSFGSALRAKLKTDLELSIGGRYQMTDFDGQFIVDENEETGELFFDSRRDEKFVFYTDLTYALNKHWQLSGHYGFTYRNSNQQRYDYDRSSISIGVSYTF